MKLKSLSSKFPGETPISLCFFNGKFFKNGAFSNDIKGVALQMPWDPHLCLTVL